MSRSARFAWPIAAVLVYLTAASQASDRYAEIAAAIQGQLDGKPSPAIIEVWADEREFYRRRDNNPAWLDRRQLSRGDTVLSILKSASQHGLDPADYDSERLSTDLDALKSETIEWDEHVQRLATLDMRLTAALLMLGRDVALGRTVPHVVGIPWEARRETPDLIGRLLEAANGDPVTWLDRMKPTHPEYAALQHALRDLNGQLEKGGWPHVPTIRYAAGDSNAAVHQLRLRLAATGDLAGPAAASQSTSYDADVKAAVRSFQEHHAIKPTGMVDAATLAALNVPIEQRIRQVAINLERWRWMPDDLGSRHFLVNIPAYILMARENGSTVLDTKVIVGKLDHETPIFSADMVHVVFSPYWNVPESIVENETAPAAARDPSFLARNNMEILRVTKSGTRVVDPSTVNWDNPSELKQLAFRQRPGAKNALGHVKFLFPNAHNVYLHDTPADSLFARTSRAFSHGCVRVEEPEAIAQYVLRDQPEWTEPRILAAMHAGVEKYVNLATEIPVHLVYFTAWVDEQNGLHFYPDVYGYDATQMRSGRN